MTCRDIIVLLLFHSVFIGRIKKLTTWLYKHANTPLVFIKTTPALIQPHERLEANSAPYIPLELSGFLQTLFGFWRQMATMEIPAFFRMLPDFA